MAAAINSGHLPVSSFLNQQLMTTSLTAMKDSIKGWRVSGQEHKFSSLLRKTPPSAAELLQGPMHADQEPHNNEVSTAKFN